MQLLLQEGQSHCSTRSRGMGSSRAALRSLVLMLKDLDAGVAFYRDGLGLRLRRGGEAMAEFDTGGTPLVLRSVQGEARCSTGYSPFICLDVPDMDSTILRVLQMGASLDGPIKYAMHGKSAAIRSPDGHMIGLFEPADQQEQQPQPA